MATAAPATRASVELEPSAMSDAEPQSPDKPEASKPGTAASKKPFNIVQAVRKSLELRAPEVGQVAL